VRDTRFGGGGIPPSFCENTEAPHVELPAHSAPLGLAFVPEEGWPEDMWLDLLVAYHGSWNRTEPTGYKIVWIELDQNTRQATGTHDWIMGWLKEGAVADSAFGRPVDLHIFPGGTLYITDDKVGVVYKVQYQQE